MTCLFCLEVDPLAILKMKNKVITAFPNFIHFSFAETSIFKQEDIHTSHYTLPKSQGGTFIYWYVTGEGGQIQDIFGQPKNILNLRHFRPRKYIQPKIY